MWTAVKRFFKHSETIFFARFQILIGVIAGALTYVDPSVLAPVIPAEWFPAFLVLNGIATEYLRRRRADDLD